MAQRSRAWAMAMATAGLIALPIIGAAQSYPSPQSGQTTSGQSTAGQSASSSSYSSADQNSAMVHLDKAKKELDDISTSSLTGDAATQISTLKTDFNDLYTSYKNKSGQSASGQAGTTGSVPPSGVTPPSGVSASGATGDWKTDYTAISRILDHLNIPATSPKGASSGSGTSGSMSGNTGSTSGTTGQTGTSGTTGSMSGYGTSSSTPMFGADVRAKLASFRMHLDEFYEAANQQGSPSASSEFGASSSQGATGTSGTMSETGAAAGMSGSSASRYLDDIDNIVNQALNKSGSSSASSAYSGTSSSTSGTTGTSGQTSTHARRGANARRVFLTREQLDQIKQDVAQLRQQIGSSK